MVNGSNMKMNQLKTWIQEIKHGDFIDEKFIIKEDKNVITIKFYTYNYEYIIKGKYDEKSDYLGCTLNCRKPRAGENWTRGSDLLDGPLDKYTWDKIKNAILASELELISPSADK